VTLIRSANSTPASFVMFLNRPPPRFFQSSLPPTLVDEVDVVEPVAIDVGNGDAAVIVMDRLVVLARVLDDVVNEGDAAFLDLVGEPEPMEDRELVRRRKLRLPARLERIRPDVRIRKADLSRCRCYRRPGTAAPADERRTERKLHDQAP
jgi:hypothetical protein